MDKDQNSKPKIVNIETVADLHKIPFNILKTKQIYEFKGKYFDQIYKEALELEKKESENKQMIKFIYCKRPKKDTKEKKLFQSINLVKIYQIIKKKITLIKLRIPTIIMN